MNNRSDKGAQDDKDNVNSQQQGKEHCGTLKKATEMGTVVVNESIKSGKSGDIHGIEEKTDKEEVSVMMVGVSPHGPNIKSTSLQEPTDATHTTRNVDVQLEAINKHCHNLLEKLCHVNERNLQNESTTEEWVDRTNRYFEDQRSKVLNAPVNMMMETMTMMVMRMMTVMNKTKETLEGVAHVSSTALKDK